MNEFQGQGRTQVGSFQDPISVLFQFCWSWVVNPKIDFSSLIFTDFDSHAGDVLNFSLWWDSVWEQQIFPESIAFGSFKSENEGATFLIIFVFPDWLDVWLEKVNVWSFFELAWSLEMLIECPQVFNCGNLSDGKKGILEITFSLNEILIPKLKFSMKL